MLQYNLIAEGDLFFSKICQAIRAARHEVLCEYYIFDVDPVGLVVLQELKAAHQRGCRVRLIVDGIGSQSSVTSLRQICKEAGIELVVFNPLRLRLRWLLTALNRRNHRKVTLIDQRQLFLGSFNITRVHSAKDQGEVRWQDLGIELSLHTIDGLQELSQRMLSLGSFPLAIRRRQTHKLSIASALHRLIRPETLRARWAFYRELRQRINLAQKKIWIATPYFVPPHSLLRSLIKAKTRGVHVVILVPFVNDVAIVDYAMTFLFRRLRHHGIEVYQFQQRTFHSKYCFIDDWTLLGSLNWNHRSFLHDLEILFESDEPEFSSQMQAQWHRDLKNSLTLTNSGQNTPIKRLFGRLAWMLRYWL